MIPEKGEIKANSRNAITVGREMALHARKYSVRGRLGKQCKLATATEIT